MVSKLWPDSPSSVSTTALLLSQTVYGIAFVPDVTQYLHGVRFYRNATGSANKADSITLWHAGTQGVVAHFGNPVDDGTVGWQTTLTGSVIELTAGQEYRIGWYQLGGSVRTNSYKTTAPSDPANDLAFASTVYRYIQNTYAYPTLNAASYYPLIDVLTDDNPPDPDAGSSAGDINNQLASWLISTGDNTHQTDGIPWLSYVMQQGMNTNLDTLLEKLDNGGWPVALGGVNKADLPAWLSAGGTIISTISTVVANLQTAQGPTGDLPGDTLTGGLLALQAQIQNGDQRWLTAPGAAGWTLDDTVPFAGPFVVDAEADVIFVNITTIGSANRSRTVGGLDFLTFPWWWVPLRAGAIVGTHRTCMALSADLYEPGRRLPGALVVVPEDFEGEYELWRFTG